MEAAFGDGLRERYNTKSDEVKAATFLHVAGPEALDVFNTFSFDSAGDEKKLSKLMEKFEAYCIPRKNITWVQVQHHAEIS